MNRLVVHGVDAREYIVRLQLKMDHARPNVVHLALMHESGMVASYLMEFGLDAAGKLFGERSRGVSVDCVREGGYLFIQDEKEK